MADKRLDCAECEALLADALDGRLNPAQQSAFDEHAGQCTLCGQMVEDARRGLAWLEILKQTRPEPPARLLANILAQTSGRAFGQSIGDARRGAAVALPGGGAGLAAGLGAAAALSSATGRSGLGLEHLALGNAAASGGTAYGAHGTGMNRPALYGWARAGLATVMQPRMAMTAAMAFFSISLTLNLMGVRLSDLKPSDLQPSNLRRQFYETNARMIRNLDNLRVVYEVEARVGDLRRASEPDGSNDSDRPIPASKEPKSVPEGKQSKPKGDGGTSRRDDGRDSKSQHAGLGTDGAARQTAAFHWRRRQGILAAGVASAGQKSVPQTLKPVSMLSGYGTSKGVPPRQVWTDEWKGSV